MAHHGSICWFVWVIGGGGRGLCTSCWTCLIAKSLSLWAFPVLRVSDKQLETGKRWWLALHCWSRRALIPGSLGQAAVAVAAEGGETFDDPERKAISGKGTLGSSSEKESDTKNLLVSCWHRLLFQKRICSANTPEDESGGFVYSVSSRFFSFSSEMSVTTPPKSSSSLWSSVSSSSSLCWIARTCGNLSFSMAWRRLKERLCYWWQFNRVEHKNSKTSSEPQQSAVPDSIGNARCI